jgi:probable F420-dependent oxidoreductase
MEIGFNLPHSGALTSTANIAKIAQEAEQMGYATLWTYERLLRPLGPVPLRVGPPRPLPESSAMCYEPLETLSYVAALTSRIKLATSVVVALFHPPVVLARRYATLDQLSGGRAIVGIGQGYIPEEFETANVPMEHRGARMDEMIAAMRACWGPDPVSYEGRFYKIAPSEIEPKPKQEKLKVFMGSMTQAGVKRAARISDGLIVVADSLDVLNTLIPLFMDSAEEFGRNPKDLPIVVRSNGPVTKDALEEQDRHFLTGSPAQIADDMAKMNLDNIDEVMFDDDDTGDLTEALQILEELKTVTADMPSRVY